MGIVECVPNFSEGRDEKIVSFIREAISSVEGISVLDSEMNPDHNRAVITFAGDSSIVVEAAFRGIKRAAELIDMTVHKGEHPRFGAADVVPFVPVTGNIEECIKLAGDLAGRVARELSIPVYLYGSAAKIPWRSNLENIRNAKFQIEELREHISEDKWKPDAGPQAIGKAGACIIGAREYLVAYNVNLNTPDVDVAKKVSKQIREKAGGLKNVKALGFYLSEKNRAQVSMNLVDFKSTPVYRAYENVRMEAARYGATPVESEIVGLIPLKAVLDTAAYYLKMESIPEDQIFETRLSKSMSQDTLGDFMSKLASSSPTPGGGAASAMVGAIAAALSSMVASLTAGRKAYASVSSEMEKIIAESRGIMSEMTRLMKQDEEAFNGISAVWKMPKETEEQKEVRNGELQRALVDAIGVPMKIAKGCRSILGGLKILAEKGNKNAISDVACSAEFAFAAIRGASSNVLINAKSLASGDESTRLVKETATLIEDSEKILKEIRKIVDSKIMQGN